MEWQKNKVEKNVAKDEIPEAGANEKVTGLKVLIDGKPVEGTAKVRVEYRTKRFLREKLSKDKKFYEKVVLVEGPCFFETDMQNLCAKAAQNAWTKPNPDDVKELVVNLKNSEGKEVAYYDNSAYFKPSEGGTGSRNGWSESFCKILADVLANGVSLPNGKKVDGLPKSPSAERILECSKNGNDILKTGAAYRKAIRDSYGVYYEQARLLDKANDVANEMPADAPAIG